MWQKAGGVMVWSGCGCGCTGTDAVTSAATDRALTSMNEWAEEWRRAAGSLSVAPTGALITSEYLLYNS